MQAAGPIRVLVVDDNPALRLVVQSLLRRHAGIEIVGEAGNGEEALALIGQVAPHVVVMDINMPRMNGVEATRCMTKRYPGIIVIGLTLNDDVATTSTMHDAGASAVVQKERVLDDLHLAILNAVAPSANTGRTKDSGLTIETHRDAVIPGDGVDPGNPPASTSLN
jgi:DNA-binding NarL/FixJ family response regulator